MEPQAVEILLVEDDPNDVELTLRAMAKHNLANKVQVVRDGTEALEFIFRTDRHADRAADDGLRLILLDLKLPKVSGLEVLGRVKENTRTRNIPVVVLSSSRDQRDIVDSYKLGVNSYVVKPIEFDKFVESVSEVGLYWLLINERPPEANGHNQ
ncbi:MAG: response regulator [Gemmatimonadales bacterium]